MERKRREVSRLSSEPIEGNGPFLPPNIIIPEDWKDARLTLTDYLIKAAEAINARDIAQYMDIGVVNGQDWFTPGEASKFRQGSRKVISTGSLPNAGTTTTAHGISVSSNTIFTRIYGVASNPGTSYIPIPFVDTGGSHVEITVDSTDVNLVTTIDFSAYTITYVVLEWIESV